jgi:hypothetical protein
MQLEKVFDASGRGLPFGSRTSARRIGIKLGDRFDPFQRIVLAIWV